EWVHVQLHQQKGMISLSPPTICNSALLRTDAWSYPVLRLKRLGLSRTFRRLVVTLTRRYGVSLIHLDAGAECLPGLPTFDW
ncbi:DUF5983 family protein, partial [Klebsiella pneumoniae]